MFEAVRERESGAVLEVGRKLIAVEVGLELVGHQDHDHVRPGRRLGRRHHLKAGALRLGGRCRAGAQRDHHVAHAAVVQVIGMAEPLAAIADHRDVLALDQVQIGIGVVVDAHGRASVLFRGASAPGEAPPAPHPSDARLVGKPRSAIKPARAQRPLPSS